MTNIVPANSIDYSNVDEICGYQMLLCKIFEKSGGFGVGVSSGKEIVMVKREGITWLQLVKGAINKVFEAPITYGRTDEELTLGDIPRILTSYDFLYRICHQEPCFTYVRDIILKVTDRWIKGDKSISSTCVTLLLQKEITRDIRLIPKRYSDFAMSTLGSWVKELNISGRLQDISTEDAYSVISFLLWQNLSVFDVKENDKRRWIETYTLSDSEIDNLDSRALWAYMDFVQNASSFLGESIEEQDEKYNRLISKVASHKDTNRFTCQAIELYLANTISA
ncbi:MAG: hypothetical protein NC453_23320 [Muribaculum sp.]|nr:hypothetical protein [Muribaculum sp.]